MSRIGRLPIAIPNGVTVTVTPDNVVTVKGPKGELTENMNKNVNIEVKDAEILVSKIDEQRRNKALQGLTRSLINNMVVGVTEGYQKTLELIGVGYRAQLQGDRKSVV